MKLIILTFTITFYLLEALAQSVTFEDNRDGKTYKIVSIGNQTWMAENLNFITKKGSFCYNNELTNCEKYGRLYLWKEAKKACPKGWHLPSYEEFDNCLKQLGDDAENVYENIMINGNSGFNALPAGRYDNEYNSFYDMDISGNWWSSKKSGKYNIWYLFLRCNKKAIGDWGAAIGDTGEKYGFSVRCIKNK